MIGNPPYGAALIDKPYLKKFYPKTSHGNIDSYKYFLEKGISLLKDNCTLSFIVSDSFLEKEYFTDLRRLIIEKSSLVRTVKLGDNIFKEVNLPTAIISLNSGSQFTELKSSDVSSATTIIDKISAIVHKAVNYIDDPLLKFTVKKHFFSLANTKPLIDIYDQVMGVKVYQIGKGKPKQSKTEIENNLFISDKSHGPEWKKFIDSGVKRYNINDYNKYIKYGEWLAEPRKIEYFNKPKIILREIVNPRVFAAYFEEEAIIKNTNAVIIKKNSEFSLKYLLAILNSKLFTFYIINNAAKSKNKLFPSITSKILKEFPVKIASKNTQQIFSDLVDELTSLAESERNRMELILDISVYKLYGLNFEDASLIERKDNWVDRELFEFVTID